MKRLRGWLSRVREIDLLLYCLNVYFMREYQCKLVHLLPGQTLEGYTFMPYGSAPNPRLTGRLFPTISSAVKAILLDNQLHK